LHFRYALTEVPLARLLRQHGHDALIDHWHAPYGTKAHVRPPEQARWQIQEIFDVREMLNPGPTATHQDSPAMRRISEPKRLQADLEDQAAYLTEHCALRLARLRPWTS
jgi:hypothetical protein